MPTSLRSPYNEADKRPSEKSSASRTSHEARRDSGRRLRARPGEGAGGGGAQAGLSEKRSAGEGGGYAGSAAGGSVGRPRWLSILRSTSAASNVAMMDMRPPHRGHTRTSRPEDPSHQVRPPPVARS